MPFIEKDFNAVLTAAAPKRADSEQEDKLNGHLSFRVIDDDTIDSIIETIAGEELRKHLRVTGNGGGTLSVHEWLEAFLAVGSSMHFVAKYEAHSLHLSAGGKKIADFGDCKISAFTLSNTKGNIDVCFKVQANAIHGKDQLGPVNDFVARSVLLKLKKAKHWQEQTDLIEDAPELTDEEKEAQEKIERAKEAANKANTSKARSKTPAKKKAAAKKATAK